MSSHYEKFLATGEVKCIDEEIPFEIPKGWEWCRLCELCSRFSTGPFGTMVHKSDYTDDGVPLVNPTNIKGHKITTENICKISPIKYKELKSYTLSENDIVLARRGDLSKCAIVDKTQSGWLAGTGSFFLHILCLSLDYFILVYSSPYAQLYLLGDSVGTTMNNLNQGLLSRMLIPIPPLKEQAHIVLQYSSFMPLLKQYDLAYCQRKALDDLLPLQIRKSILQEAVQGKLVPQIAEEGTAKELFEQIKAEKQILVKEGKLKKSALTDSVIFRGDDNKYYERINKEVIEIELPYDYPDSWCVVRLKDVCQLIDGVKMTGKGVCLDAKYLRGKSSPAYLDKGRFIQENDSIILVDGENSGEVFTVPVDGYMGSTFKQLWLSTAMYKPYMLAFILFHKEALRNSKRGAAIPHLNKELFYNLPIGIPPYKEQERISQRIDVLFQLLK